MCCSIGATVTLIVIPARGGELGFADTVLGFCTVCRVVRPHTIVWPPLFPRGHGQVKGVTVPTQRSGAAIEPIGANDGISRIGSPLPPPAQQYDHESA